ncbi:uncharacterized protein LOC127282330 [Leptopilina boulardi]|uniref:uncharacterized protein LOC127282330 n=1 Tax=Leptopilina boulardi TaxID=63433 RepID=UPI0021F6628C|nr:uncharacterized protein LOC127282330 [Leptopilina boulardi]
MDLDTFNELLRLVHPYLVKRSPRALPPEHRLLTALRYYATGDLILSVSLAFRIGETTARNIIKEVAQVLVQVLAPTYLQPPNTQKWCEIMAHFLREWNFPNCVGALDGKHFPIKAPPNSGSLYYNYKKQFSIVLLATCDASYKFTLVHVGEMGSNNDAGIFNESPIGQSMRGQELGLPLGRAALPGTELTTPPLFLGDGIFPTKRNLIIPYSGNNLDEATRIFNYRLSRARRVIENAFGILVARWRIFKRILELEVDCIDLIILATICLHNFLRSKHELENPPVVQYCPPRFVDWEDRGNVYPGEWRGNNQGQLHPLPVVQAANETTEGRRIRNILMNYFQTAAGEIPWQYDYVRDTGN